MVFDVLFLIFRNYLHVCLSIINTYVCVWAGAWHGHMWSLEDSFQESSLCVSGNQS